MSYEKLELLIGGEWKNGAAGKTESVINPATEEVLAELPHASPEDLDRVVARWNSWADSVALDDYAAWTLTPFYYTPQQEFDVIWLGASKDAVIASLQRISGGDVHVVFRNGGSVRTLLEGVATTGVVCRHADGTRVIYPFEQVEWVRAR